jgi:hypothetical protein
MVSTGSPAVEGKGAHAEPQEHQPHDCACGMLRLSPPLCPSLLLSLLSHTASLSLSRSCWRSEGVPRAPSDDGRCADACAGRDCGCDGIRGKVRAPPRWWSSHRHRPLHCAPSPDTRMRALCVMTSRCPPRRLALLEHLHPCSPECCTRLRLVPRHSSSRCVRVWSAPS